FCRWEGDALKPVASWHSESGYNQNDPTFSEGTRYTQGGESTSIRVLCMHGTDSDGDGYNYELTRDSKPFGKMHVVWKDESNYPTESHMSEDAWLFEKTTGLPRRLFPGQDNASSLPKFEDLASVTVEGNAEAANFFGCGR